MESNLYAACLRGDREAFGEIVRQYQNLVNGVAYSITGNVQESEDLAQETFIAAWQRLRELREVEKLPAWLCGIARNLANNYLRRTQVERQKRSESTLETLPAVAIEEESEKAGRIALLWATLKEIPLQFREPLVMYYQQNQSVQDIAAALEISESNVRQRIARGRTYLKKEVERHVEKTLAFIRPSEHFTVAVLAALPILATSEQVLAASAAGAAASQSASSSGAGAAASSVAGHSTFFWTLFVGAGSVLPTIITGLGVVLGIWSGVRNAPTLRARHLMIKTVLGYFIGACIFFLLTFMIIAGINYAIVNNRLAPEKVPLYNFCVGIHVFLMIAVPILVIMASYRINRQWRTIIEKDLSQSQTVVSKDSLRSVYIWGGIALFTLLLVSAVFLFPLRGIWTSWLFLYIIPTILIFGIPFFYYAVRISKDQSCMEKYPPRLPNLLSILTGEEKAPRGFRNRINFWGDLTGIGWGLFAMHVALFGHYFRSFGSTTLKPIEVFGISLGNGHTLLYVLLLLAYFLFALFFAGIPRRWYWGMIFLGVSMLLINSCVPYMMSEPLSGRHLYLYGLYMWYLLCFTFIGAAGLRAFRKKNI
jgi:RNA polymerase sigma factor (sigma-70 family)